jgi:WhiB family transcriptional regulator, redox-sensing transcriptional regulator
MAVRTVEETWQRRAACRGPESVLFFAPTLPEPRGDRDAREARAKKICGGCDVRVECLEYALRIKEPHGIWGGLNESERRALIETV